MTIKIVMIIKFNYIEELPVNYTTAVRAGPPVGGDGVGHAVGVTCITSAIQKQELYLHSSCDSCVYFYPT